MAADGPAPASPHRRALGGALSVELHLPDLPEVPLSLLPPVASPMRPPMPWHQRARDTLASYLPLLLMATLALATWWLVRQSPGQPEPGAQPALSGEPDYTMSDFALERFDVQGRLKLRIVGQRLRHYPDTDRIEIDEARIRAIAPDGRVTLAHARQAVGSGDGSEIELRGGAEVRSLDAEGGLVLMQGEVLHAFVQLQQVRSQLPVRVLVGDAELRGAGLDYDHPAQRLSVIGPLRTQLPPRGSGGAPLSQPSGASP